MYSIRRKRTTPVRLACEFVHDCLVRLSSNSRDTAENLYIWVKWALNLAGARFRFYALPPPFFLLSLSLSLSRFHCPATTSWTASLYQGHIPSLGQTASHSLPFPISFRGTPQPISTAQPWQSYAPVIRRARPSHKLNRSRNWSAESANVLG
jgi:hypothetical protein